MKEKLIGFVKKEAVLCIAALCAVITMFFVPPDGAYPGAKPGQYIGVFTLYNVIGLAALLLAAWVI